MKLQTKMYFIGTAVPVAIVFLIMILAYCQFKQSGITEITKDMNTIHVLTLENRRREKDFFIESNLKYSDMVKQQSQEIINIIQRLKTRNPDHKSRELLRHFENHTKDYSKIFDEVVGLHFKKGLNDVSGFRGELREAIHKTESILAKRGNKELEIQMLILRRREKDYFIRRDLKYIDELAKDYNKFKQVLNSSFLDGKTKTELNQSSEIYMNVMKKIVEIDTQINKKTKEFKFIVHKVEPEIEEFLKHMEIMNNKSRAHIFQIIIFSIVVAVGLCAIILYIICKGILLPFSKLKSILRKGVQGNFSQRYEIPQLKSENEARKLDDISALGLQINNIFDTIELFSKKLEALSNKDYQAEVMKIKLPESLEKIIENLEFVLKFPSDHIEISTEKDKVEMTKNFTYNMTAILNILARKSYRVSKQILERENENGKEITSAEEPIREILELLRSLSSQAEMMTQLLQADKKENKKSKDENSN